MMETEIADPHRGTGRTSRAMLAAAPGAVYLWHDDRTLFYPRELAKSINRADLEVVGPSWMEFKNLAGKTMTGFVMDHAVRAASMSDRQWDAYEFALTRVRAAPKVQR